MRSLGDYKKTITKEFVTALSKLHPERFANTGAYLDTQSPLGDTSHILRQTLDICHTIFTLNYDLLLHWLAANYKEQTPRKFVDAFYLDEESPKDCKKIYYLHGAMHLFEGHQATEKLKAQGKQLTERISN